MASIDASASIACKHNPYGEEPKCETCFQEAVNHPAHYGGEDNPYEAIKVIEAWGLDFPLGNAVKYISRAGKKGKDKELEDLKKAAWYVARRIEQLEGVTITWMTGTQHTSRPST